MFSLALRLRIRPATALGWRRRLRLVRLAVVDRAVPRGPVVARAARKLATVRFSAVGPMTTLPEPSPASCAGNWTSWIGLSADSATSPGGERVAVGGAVW